MLYVDATCINYDGNAFDATLLAMVAALKNSECPRHSCFIPPSSCTTRAVTLPKATYDEDRHRTVCSRKIREPLQIGRLPTSYSFGIFDG